MRVALVTPMSPESAIGDVMIQAVPHLSTRWDIEVWCPSEPEYRPCPVPVRPFRDADEEVRDALSEYDLVIYVLGNSPWHSRILPLARSLPGLVVLHDVAMTDMVRRTALETGELDSLTRRIAADSSLEDADVFSSGHHPDGPSGWLEFSADNPLMDYAIETSLGVVVHSAWHAEKVAGLTLGDVTVASLPIPSARLGFESNERGGVEALLEELPDDAILLVTVGAANANRRIDALLEAVAADPVLAAQVHFWAVGPAHPKAAAALHDHARRLDIDASFVVTGAVSDSLLQEILTRADVAAALRDPVLEGQSASVFTQMLAGAPLVVFDHAHYAELPDDVVVKVAPDASVSELAAALRILVDHPDERRARGERGRDHALATRSGDLYATALLDAGDRALAARPVVHLGTDLATRMRRVGLHTVPAATDLVTEIAFELYDLE